MESHSIYASHENYYSILYEEINSKPFEEAADIFKFLGLRMSHEVDTWITANTRKGPSLGGRPVSNTRVKRELDMGIDISSYHLIDILTGLFSVIQTGRNIRIRRSNKNDLSGRQWT